MKIPETLRWKPAGKTLGAGGQGVVEIVTDRTGERSGSYALKTIKSGARETAYKRFVTEISVMKILKHPGIVRIIDHSADDDSYRFYVMEFFEGASSLKQLLGTKSNPFYADAIKSLKLLIQILEALRACESVDIVHRDLSPANVLILPDGQAKIIDFGLCQVEDGESVTLTDEGVGTPNYMAPECEAGAGQTVSWQADLYSAGKILWSAITNSAAFSRENPAFNAKSMNTMFPDRPNTWHLEHIFAKTIRHRLEDRFQSSSDALATAWRVVSLIDSGFPPLQRIMEKCPVCGWGNCVGFQGSHMVFGNPNPTNINASQCNYCGFCMAVDIKVRNDNLRNPRSFQ